MMRQYWLNLKNILRQPGELFWPLVFPLMLGTLFYVTFGTGSDMMQPIPVALVSEGNTIFEFYLDNLDGGILSVTEMEEGEALLALQAGGLDGIFYSKSEPTLTVTGTEINESILGSLLQGYLEHQAMLQEISEDGLVAFSKAVLALTDYQDYIAAVNISGNETDGNLDYFWALIAMACLFGSFLGMETAIDLRADQSALAARKCIAPISHKKMVICGILAVFTVQFVNMCLLLIYLHFVLQISFGEKWMMLIPVMILGSMTGAALGTFIGTLKMREGTKVGILVSVSLFMSFLAGLMFGGMKAVVEQYCPIVNRINPAALISEAIYSISVYDNPVRYGKSLLNLALIAGILVFISCVRMGRERYDNL